MSRSKGFARRALVVSACVVGCLLATLLPSGSAPVADAQLVDDGEAAALEMMTDWSNDQMVEAAAAFPQQRITLGQQADPFEHPTIVAMVTSGLADTQIRCGGTLISATIVLTAAHCVDFENPNSPNIDLIVGTWTLAMNLGERIPACSITLHPDWDRNLAGNDIALVELCRAHHHPTAAIPSASSAASTGTNITIAGWGAIDSDMNNDGVADTLTFPGTLMEAEMPIRSKSDCEGVWGNGTPPFVYLHDSHICVGVNGTNSCRGDSGGPMYNGDYVVGLASWGPTLCEGGAPSVYTRIYKYRNWIQSETGIAPDTTTPGIPCLNRFATFLGTGGDDVVPGTARGDVNVTYGGDDTISASAGLDTSCTGDGNDEVFAGPDGAVGVTGAGNDFFRGGPSADAFLGGNGNDTAFGGDGNDVMAGDGGNDKLRGQDGGDYLDGGKGADDLNGGADDDTVLGGDDDDPAVRGGTGDDYVDGGDGDDALVNGNGGEDTVLGGPGKDNLFGGPRQDWMDGGPGNDVMKGLGGADTMLGSGGNDDLFGGAQPDVLDGGGGTDLCNGGSSPDTSVDCETNQNI